MVVAIKAIDWYNPKAGKTVKRIVDEVHHLNSDCTGTMEI
jgi:hypothetical protein